MMIAGGIIGGVRTEGIFLAAASNSSSPLNNFTQADQPLGEEHPSRQIILLVLGRNANLVSDQNYTTGVAVGGVSAVRKFALPDMPINFHWSGWITPRQDAGGPSGTTGTITVTRSTGNGFNFAAFVAFAAYNLRNSDPVHVIDGVGNPASLAVNLAGGGILTALGYIGSNTPFTWSGADEVADQAAGVSGSERISGALLSRTPGGAGYVITANTGATCSALAVSWR